MWGIQELTAMIRSLMMEGMSVPAAAAATRVRKTRSFILFKFFVGPRTLEEGLRRAFGKDLLFIPPQKKNKHMVQLSGAQTNIEASLGTYVGFVWFDFSLSWV